MKQQKYPLQKPKKLPGSVWENNGFWYWRGTLPGTESRRAYPLKTPSGRPMSNVHTREVAEREAWRLWQRAADGLRPEPSGRRQRLDRLIEDYLPTVEQAYKSARTGRPSPHARLFRQILTQLHDSHGKRPAEAVNGQFLQSFVESRIRAGLKRGTINKHLMVLRQFYAWLLASGHIDATTEAAVARFPKLQAGRTRAAESSPVMPADIEAVRAMLDELTPTVRDMVLVQYICSMRPDEVCQMTPANIDTRDVDIWMYEPTHSKTAYRKKLRIVAILPEARAIIERRMAGRAQSEPIFRADESYEEWKAGQRGASTMIAAGEAYEPDSYSQNARQEVRFLAGENMENLIRRFAHV